MEFFRIMAMVGTLMIIAFVVVSWQRARYRYVLAKMAIERGMAEAPMFTAGTPLWLLSLRKGVVLMVIGLGLLAVGMVTGQLPPPQPYVPLAATRAVGDPGASAADLKMAESISREKWNIKEQRKMVIYYSMGIGGILTLLGLTRVVFSLLEKRYTKPARVAEDGKPWGG